jgi:DNA-binding NarL/FixJ family response regulator
MLKASRPEPKNNRVKTKRIRVLLAEDHTVVRQGLRLILDTSDEIKVVGEAENGRQAVTLAKDLKPDIALLDVAMPMLNGLEAIKQLRRDTPAIKVLILSSYDDDRFIDEALAGGASGYLLKHSAANDLIKAIHEVHQGRTFYSPAIQKRLASRRLPNGSPRPGDKLSRREAEVLQLIAEGFANKQIADELKISVKTVEKHRQSMMNKLNIHEVAGLTRYAVSRGMVGQPSPVIQ